MASCVNNMSLIIIITYLSMFVHRVLADSLLALLAVIFLAFFVVAVLQRSVICGRC